MTCASLSVIINCIWHKRIHIISINWYEWGHQIHTQKKHPKPIWIALLFESLNLVQSKKKTTKKCRQWHIGDQKIWSIIIMAQIWFDARAYHTIYKFFFSFWRCFISSLHNFFFLFAFFATLCVCVRVMYLIAVTVFFSSLCCFFFLSYHIFVFGNDQILWVHLITK